MLRVVSPLRQGTLLTPISNRSLLRISGVWGTAVVVKGDQV